SVLHGATESPALVPPFASLAVGARAFGARNWLAVSGTLLRKEACERRGKAASPPKRGSVLWRNDFFFALQELQPVLQLGDAQLELLVLRPEDETQLAQHSLKAGTSAFGDPRGVAPPSGNHVVDRSTSLVALHASALRERVDELLDPLRGQGDGSDASEQ